MTHNYWGLEHGATVTFFGELVKSRTCHLAKFSVFNTWVESLMCLTTVLIIKIALHISLEVEIIIK